MVTLACLQPDACCMECCSTCFREVCQAVCCASQCDSLRALGWPFEAAACCADDREQAAHLHHSV